MPLLASYPRLLIYIMDCNSTYLPATTTINNPSLLGGCAPSSQYMYFVDSSRNSNDNTTVQVTRNSHDSSNAGTRFVVYQITIAHQIGSASAAPIDNKLSITLVSDNNADNGRWCISSLSNQQQ